MIDQWKQVRSLKNDRFPIAKRRPLLKHDGSSKTTDYHIKVVNKYTVDFILKLMMQGKPTILSEDPELVAAVSNSSLFVLLVASADPTTGAFLTQKSSF